MLRVFSARPGEKKKSKEQLPLELVQKNGGAGEGK